MSALLQATPARQATHATHATEATEATSLHTWILDGRAVAPSEVPELAQRLSEAERVRLQRFLKPRRAQEFLLGRLLLRHALCQQLGCREADITVTERPGAAPLVAVAGHVADGQTLPGLSLSHSHGWIACAVGSNFPLGVDIEASAPQRDLVALADVSFSQAELAWLQGQSDHARAFHRLWGAKEAIFKHGHNAGQTQQGLPRLHCIDGHEGPLPQQGFLHYQGDDDVHVSLFSKVQPQQQHQTRLQLDALRRT